MEKTLPETVANDLRLDTFTTWHAYKLEQKPCPICRLGLMTGASLADAPNVTNSFKKEDGTYDMRSLGKCIFGN